jgi:N utilization substance protein B
MFSRRLLRIKVLQILYAYYKADGKTFASTEKDLLFSLEKSHQLYHLLLQLILEVVDYAESRIMQAREKRIPTEQDLNPNTRFIDNQVIKQLRNNSQLRAYLQKHPLSWGQYPEIVKNLYSYIIDAEFYDHYMNHQEPSYQHDKQIIERIYANIIMNYEDLYINLEEQSIFWTGDVDFIIKMILKTLKKFSQDQVEEVTLMPMFKEKDDLEYAKKLLRKTIKNEKDCLDLIKATANNWELERIAFTDSLILQLAISEVMEFPTIPVKVTINEFIEIAKLYSTHKSSQFINGILDSIIAGLRSEGRFVKQGRGLIGEI